MPKRHELTIPCQPLQRSPFENIIPPKTIQEIPPKDEETPVDPLVQNRLLAETANPTVGRKVEDPELGRGIHHRDRANPPMSLVKLHELLDVDIGDSVPIGDHEGILIGKERSNTLDPSTGIRVFASVGECDPPVFPVVVHETDLRLLCAEVEAEVVMPPAQVFHEVLLDGLSSVSEAENEVIKAMCSVDLHDVPEDRPAADVDQGFGDRFRMLLEPGSFAAAENDNLHLRLPLPTETWVPFIETTLLAVGLHLDQWNLLHQTL
jgi:hypothetical protein